MIGQWCVSCKVSLCFVSCRLTVFISRRIKWFKIFMVSISGRFVSRLQEINVIKRNCNLKFAILALYFDH